MATLEADGIEALVVTSAEGQRRRHDFRPTGFRTAVKEAKAAWLRDMATKLDSEESRTLYRLRRQTVEPVFGMIKAVLGFTGFSLRGLDKVISERTLVALAYNCKRMHKLTPGYGVMTAFLARRLAPDASAQPAVAGYRHFSDHPNPILAVASNVDRTAERPQPNPLHTRNPSTKSDRLLALRAARPIPRATRVLFILQRQDVPVSPYASL